MATVELDDREWQQVLAILGGTRDFPWNVTNPLLMKIGGQLSEPSNVAPISPGKRSGNKEIRHE